MATGSKLRRRSKRQLLQRDRWRALALSLLFGGAALAGMGTVVQYALPIAFHGGGSTYGKGELATGSVIIVPVIGNTCRKRTIVNANWQIYDIGFVDCREALAQNAQANQGWSLSRVDVIRDSFYNRSGR